MGLFSESLNDFNDLFMHQLKDVYDAEYQLIDALPKMADAAKNPQLKQAFVNHLSETREHARRLETVFARLQKSPERVTCPAMKGLVKEGSEAVNATGDDDVRDAALIASAQRVEHYEIAAYGTLRTLARTVGLEDIADIFQQTLDEEGEADKMLTQVAESYVNVAAARH
jgi:ferritin-like metal-binding protein YciE